MNSTLLITSESTSQLTRKALFTCAVYTNELYFVLRIKQTLKTLVSWLVAFRIHYLRTHPMGHPTLFSQTMAQWRTHPTQQLLSLERNSFNSRCFRTATHWYTRGAVSFNQRFCQIFPLTASLSSSGCCLCSLKSFLSSDRVSLRTFLLPVSL